MADAHQVDGTAHARWSCNGRRDGAQSCAMPQCNTQCDVPHSNLDVHGDTLWSSGVVHSHRTVMCVAAKAGSMAWRSLLLRSSGDRHWKEAYPVLVHGRIPRVPFLSRTTAQQFLQNDSWTRIAFVRDPARRLYSTYVDKIVRQQASPKFLDDLSRRLNCSRNSLSSMGFPDFVARVQRTLGTRNEDMHWQPQSAGCLSPDLAHHWQVYPAPEDPDTQQKMLECVLNSMAKRSPRPSEVLRLNDTFALLSSADRNNHTQHTATRANRIFTPALLHQVHRMYRQDYSLFFSGSCSSTVLKLATT